MVVEEVKFSAATSALELPHNKIHLYKRMSPDDDVSSGMQFLATACAHWQNRFPFYCFNFLSFVRSSESNDSHQIVAY